MIQLVSIGVQLIRNFSDFEIGIQNWFDLPAGDRTWIRVKTNFESV